MINFNPYITIQPSTLKESNNLLFPTSKPLPLRKPEINHSDMLSLVDDLKDALKSIPKQNYFGGLKIIVNDNACNLPVWTQIKFPRTKKKRILKKRFKFLR